MCTINYADIADKYIEVLKYCLKFSDSFSVITNVKKPYSKTPPICEHAPLDWDLCLAKQVVGIKKWPGTETRDNKKVMNVYNSRKFRTTITDLPNLFLPCENNLPEDICFYRNEEPWFVTISHEVHI